MANRIVTATVTGESIKLSDKNAGAAGSFNAVSLAFTFDSAWDGTTKKLYFFDSFYANPVYILLTTDYYDSETGIYTVPIPAEPLAYAGNMTITIKGVDFATDGETAERIIMSASTEMKVASAIIPSTDTEPAEPTPTQAEQLLASINSVTGMTVTSETLASGSSATVTKSENVDGTINLDFGLPTGDKGDKGDTGDTGLTGATGNGISSVVLNEDYTLTINFTDSTSTTTTSIRGATGAKGDTGDTGATGNGIASIVLVSGTHAAGTTDTYRITFTDSTTFDFTVYNGADGEGAGDMLASVYDPTGKNADAFNVDNHMSGTTNKVYTATEQTKLAGIAAGAEVNVNADWNASSGDAQILNKPSTFTPSSHTHGNITNDGKLGSTADLPVFTTTDGAVTTKTATNAMYALVNGLSAVTPVTDDVIPFKDVSGSTAGYATIANILALSAGAKIETGSYTGAGTYGSSNPNSFVFTDIVPKYVIIGLSSGEYLGIVPASALTTSYAKFGMLFIITNTNATANSWYGLMCKKSEDGKTVYWYTTYDGASRQLNTSSSTYSVMGIG